MGHEPKSGTTPEAAVHTNGREPSTPVPESRPSYTYEDVPTKTPVCRSPRSIRVQFRKLMPGLDAPSGTVGGGKGSMMTRRPRSAVGSSGTTGSGGAPPTADPPINEGSF